ncbi:MAG: DUF7352 domain-containing protein [Thermodesulfobacteriota bacterium]
MTKKIYKYQLEITDNQIIKMPVGAKILTVDTQGDDNVCLWALVDPNMEYKDRKIRIIGTGHPIEDWEKLEYIGTAQQLSGGLIWHVFEVLDGFDILLRSAERKFI